MSIFIHALFAMNLNCLAVAKIETVRDSALYGKDLGAASMHDTVKERRDDALEADVEEDEWQQTATAVKNAAMSRVRAVISQVYQKVLPDEEVHPLPPSRYPSGIICPELSLV